MKKAIKVLSVALVGGAVSGSAFAAGTAPDLSALTGAVDFSTVVAAVLAIAGLLATVYVAMKGASLGLSMIRR